MEEKNLKILQIFLKLIMISTRLGSQQSINQIYLRILEMILFHVSYYLLQVLNMNILLIFVQTTCSQED